MGVSEPHRIYKKGIGLESGMNADSVNVPSFLPDVHEVRSDILDYFYEINHQDKHLVRMLDMLEASGELDNTIIVVTSDNGMPFYKLAFHKRHEYELYYIPDDPENLVNLANKKEHQKIFNALKERLNGFLLETQDPRILGTSTFDEMPFYWLWGDDAPRPVDAQSHPNLF